MQLVQYFICIATRHEHAKDEHIEELHKLWQKRKKGESKLNK